jgi:ubiquinol-cytochrome c reductase cytochrome c subunit
MPETPRRSLKARMAAPCALVGAVALVGLVVFSSGPASADTTTSTTIATTPVTGDTTTTGPTPTPYGVGSSSNGAADTTGSTLPGAQPGSVQQTPTAISALPSAGAAAAANAPANETGIIYTDLPNSFIAPGQALFAANCSSCHGAEANGKIGVAPNLQGLGAGTVDFWVSTGRMPLANTSAQAIRKPPRFSRIQTLEIAAFVQSLTPGQGTQVPIVKTSGADLENGNTLFTLNCAACHTISGAGDALAEGAYAPSLHLATPTQVVEAIRSGPGNMPRFGPGNITNTEARDIAAYVTGVLQHPNNAGGVGLGGIGPVGEGFVGLLIGVGILMLVCFWIGDRA